MYEFDGLDEERELVARIERGESFADIVMERIAKKVLRGIEREHMQRRFLARLWRFGVN